MKFIPSPLNKVSKKKKENMTFVRSLRYIILVNDSVISHDQ